MLVVIYYLLPLDRASTTVAVTLLVIGLVLLMGLVAYQVRSIVRSAYPLLRGVESLASDARGVRVQVREGRQRLVDGPFAEAKEMVGGFFLLDVATRDEAVAIAAACPAAEWATVEVRELGPCWA